MNANVKNDEICRLAARERLENQQYALPFAYAQDVMVFFRAYDALDDPDMEPDWSEHLRVINASRTDKVVGR